jgi:hypothetical protein
MTRMIGLVSESFAGPRVSARPDDLEIHPDETRTRGLDTLTWDAPLGLRRSADRGGERTKLEEDGPGPCCFP